MAANDIQDLKKSIEELTNTLKNGMREGKLGGKPSGRGSSGYSGGGGDDDKYEDIKAGRFSDAFTKGEASKYKQAKEKERDQLEKEKRNRKQAEDIRKQAERLKGKEKKAKLAEAEKFDQRADANKKAAGKAGAAKGAAAAAVAGQVADTVNKIVDVAYQVAANQIKKQSARIEAKSQLEERNIAVVGTALTKAADAMVNNVTGKTLQSAFASLKGVMEMGKAMIFKNLDDQMTMTTMNLEIRKANADSAGAIVGAATGMASQVLGMLGPVGAAFGALVSIAGNISQKEMQRQIALAEMEKEIQEQANKLTKSVIEQTEQAAKGLVDMTEKVTSAFEELTMETGKQARIMGINVRDYTMAVAATSKEISSVLMDWKTYAQIQSNYSDISGRTGIISGHEASLIGGLGLKMGVDSNVIGNIVGEMEQFNIGIADGSQMMYEISNTAAKMGLSSAKFAKNLEKNLKLAEKYQFKGGVKGLMEMSLWAQKMRVDMTKFMSSMEKFHTGNIADVLQTSAQLNVLGGNASVFSDPMSMLYNAYMDPTQYAKNMAQSIKGFGTFDSKTGETKFNIAEQMRMEAMANAYGMSREDFMNMARQTKKEERIKRTFGKKFGDKTDFVTQNAVYDEKKGWSIKVKDNSKEGFHMVGLSELSGARDKALENIYPEDTQKSIEGYVRDIYNVLTSGERGVQADLYSQTSVTDATKEDAWNTSTTLAQMKINHINENLEQYKEAVQKTLAHTITAQDIMNKMIEEGGALKALEKTLKIEEDAAQDLANNLSDTSKHLGAFINNLDMGVEQLREMFEIDIKNSKDTLNGDEVLSVAEKYDELIDLMQHNYDVINQRGQYNNKDFAESTKARLNKDENGNITGATFTLDRSMTASGKKVTEQQERVLKALQARYGAENVIQEGNNITVLTAPNSGVNTAVVTTQNSNYSSGGTLRASMMRDFIISPKHGIWETDPDDTIVGFKPGGSIDRSAQKNSGGSNNINLTVNGTLTLSTGNQKIDLMELVRNDPDSLRRLTEKILLEASSNKYGGRHTFNASRYTI